MLVVSFTSSKTMISSKNKPSLLLSINRALAFGRGVPGPRASNFPPGQEYWATFERGLKIIHFYFWRIPVGLRVSKFPPNRRGFGKLKAFFFVGPNVKFWNYLFSSYSTLCNFKIVVDAKSCKKRLLNSSSRTHELDRYGKCWINQVFLRVPYKIVHVFNQFTDKKKTILKSINIRVIYSFFMYRIKVFFVELMVSICW